MLEKITQYVLNAGTPAVGYFPQENQCFTGEVVGHETIGHSRYTVSKYQLQVGEQELDFLSYQVFTKEDLQEGNLSVWWPEKFIAEAELHQVNPQAAIEMILAALEAME